MHPSVLESSYSSERICQISQSQLSLQTSAMLHWIMVTVRHSRSLAEILCVIKEKKKKKEVGLNTDLYLMSIIKRI